jgi:hypothetical protein
MEKLNIEQLRAQFKAKPFYRLVEHYLRKEKRTKELKEAVLATMDLLPPSARYLSVAFIERWNERSYEKEFWQKDTSKVFSEIVEDARAALAWVDSPTDDETLFNMFQIVVLSYAYSASDQPNMREFIGIQGEQ